MCRSGPTQTNFAIFEPTINHDRKPKERKMTKFNSTHKFTAAAAFGAAAIFSMLSFGSNAEAAKNPLSCHGSTAKEAMECCVAITSLHRPSWMMKTGRNCHTAFSSSCSNANNYPGIAAVSFRCHLRPRPVAAFILNEGGDPPGAGGTSKRGGNTSVPN